VPGERALDLASGTRLWRVANLVELTLDIAERGFVYQREEIGEVAACTHQPKERAKIMLSLEPSSSELVTA
jgi:hypothetical protein